MDPIAFDTETEKFRSGVPFPRLVCMSYDDGESCGLLHHTEARSKFEEFLEGDRVLVGHNVAYDMGVMAAEWPDLVPKIFEAYSQDRVTDTIVRQKLIDIAEGRYRGFDRTRDGTNVKINYALDDMVLRHLGEKLSKDEKIRLGYGQYRDTPIVWWPEEFRQYALRDAQVTALVYKCQISNSRYLIDEFRQTSSAWWLKLMEAWGLRTDQKGVEQFAETLRVEYERIGHGLKAAGLLRSNDTRDTKATQKRMLKICEEKELAVVHTKKGGVALSADVCESTGDELLIDYSKLSSLKKQLSTDIPLLKKGVEMPIHPWFEVLVETGRTSSKPNVQNLPVKGKMRECFVPREGHVYASADYSGFELRTMAQVCMSKHGSSKLAEALNDGLDPHLVMASKILGMTYEETKARIDEDLVYRARQTGKVANFGFPGGLGAKRLVVFAKKQYEITLSEAEASKLKKDWLEAWPEFNKYFEKIGKLCARQSSGWESIKHRSKSEPQIVHQMSIRFRGGVTFTEACNSYFQGLAADAAKAAGFLISRACYAEPDSPLYGSRIVNFIHDEVLIEAEEARAPEAAEELARLMVVGASKFLPDVPPIAEPLLMCRWSKKAKAVRDENGRLVPWTT